MAFSVVKLALTLCCVCSTGVAVSVLSGASSPDAQSSDTALTLDGSISPSSTSSSSSTSPSDGLTTETSYTTSAPAVLEQSTTAASSSSPEITTNIPTVYAGGNSQPSGAAQGPTVNTNWLQSFFNSPSQTAGSGQTGSSYTPQYNPPQPSYTSNPSSATSSMDQLFSFFRSPSSSQQYQQQHGQYPQQNSMGTGTNLAQNSFLSMLSPVLKQSLTNNQQYSSQSGSTTGTGQSGTPPDSGWNLGSTSPKQPAQPSKSTSDSLLNELMKVLDKMPTPAPTASDSSVPSSSSSSSSSSSTPSASVQQTPSSQTAAQTVQPQSQWQTPTQAQTGATVPEPSQFNPQVVGFPNDPMQTGNVPSFGAMSSMMNFGDPTAGMGMQGLSPDPLQQPSGATSGGVNMLLPLAYMYNLRYKAKASRDLGCRTLGEMLDMDVPRTMDLTCYRSCSAIMPGGITGKRFGLTCLCCPVYVSDHAIGMRSMYRRAEAFT